MENRRFHMDAWQGRKLKGVLPVGEEREYMPTKRRKSQTSCNGTYLGATRKTASQIQPANPRPFFITQAWTGDDSDDKGL